MLMFQHPELLKWFKDFVGFRDGAGPVGSGSEQAISSSESQRLRPERLIGDSSMEIGRYTQLDSWTAQTSDGTLTLLLYLC